MYPLYGKKFENKTKLYWSNPYQDDDPKFDVVGSESINGITWLISYSQQNNRVALCNTAIEEFKSIPTSVPEIVCSIDVEITRHGFDYDYIRDDYKLTQPNVQLKWLYC